MANLVVPAMSVAPHSKNDFRKTLAPENVSPALAMAVSKTRYGRFFARYAWIGFSLICMWIGYLHVWQRGPYQDDYTRRAQYRSLAGDWPLLESANLAAFPPARIFAEMLTIDFAGQIPDHEFLVRAISTLGVGLNAFLVGLLLYRILRSWLAALLGGWCFLAPFLAFEAVLWLGTVNTIFVASFALLVLHASYGAMTARLLAARAGWHTLSALFVTGMIFISESSVVVVAIVPLLGLLVLRESDGAARNLPQTLARVAIALFVPLFILSLIYLLFYRNAAISEGRGGVDLMGAFARVPAYYVRLLWMTISPDFGSSLASETFQIGWKGLLHSWSGIGLVIAATASLVATVSSWQPHRATAKSNRGTGAAVVGIGLFWFLFGTIFPSVMLRNQILEYRLLYFPFAGLAFAAGALAWMLARRINRLNFERLLVAFAGLMLGGSSVAMLGFTYAFAARAQLDQVEIDALVRDLPSAAMPPGTFVVPIGLNSPLPIEGPHIGTLLVGVFHTTWSGDTALAEAYHRPDLITVASNSWTGTKFVERDNQVSINGTRTPVEKTVVFTRCGANLHLVEQLTIRHANGREVRVVFPIAQALRAKGKAVIANLSVLDSVPLFVLPAE